MSERLTPNPTDLAEAGIQPFEFDFGPAAPHEATLELDEQPAVTQDELITRTLRWCGGLFGATHARFIRPLANGEWLVYTRQQDATLTHLADAAEIAMAYTVGLGKQPLVVTRPRISRLDGSGLRPIALKSYLGIPIVCQDRLVGVFEFAGDVRPDMDSALYSAAPRLANIGERLLFDPGLVHQSGAITVDTLVSLASGIWSRGEVSIEPNQFRFLAAISGQTTIGDIASASGLSPEQAIEIATDLLDRGLITPHDR